MENQLKNTYIGQIFRQERIANNLTLENIAKELRVTREHIDALERGDFHFFSAFLYANGLAKKYAEFLGFDIDRSLQEFERAWPKTENFKKPKPISKLAVKKLWREYLTARNFIITAIILSFIAVIIYFTNSTFLTAQKPRFSFIYPTDDMLLKSPALIVRGTADKHIELTLNNQPIYIDTDGAFNQALVLHKGINILKLEGKNNFGRTAVIERRVVVE